MMRSLSRRDFLRQSAAVAGVATLGLPAFAAQAPLFKISLAQWSLHKSFGRGGKATLDPLDFAKIAKQQFGIDAIEYVNQFYATKKNDNATVAELKKRAEGEGVTSVLIMVDGEGALGDPDAAKRAKTVDNHKRWLEWAKALGCHSIRVNAQTGATKERAAAADQAADGLRKLSEVAAPLGLNVIVENHGGLSSDGAWLADVMKKVNLKNCGTLPDFGNFGSYDRYKGVDELMPFAKGVSAKSHEFNDKGDEVRTDYKKMLELVVKKHNYHGFVGIEYEGSKLPEPAGIQATKKLLEKVRAELA